MVLNLPPGACHLRQSPLHMFRPGEAIALAWIRVTSDFLKGDY